MHLFFKIILVLALVTSGCTESVTTSSGVFGDDVSIKRSSLLSSHRNLEDSNTQPSIRPGALVRGNDQFVKPSRTNDNKTVQTIVTPRSGDLVELSLVNASIEAASQAVLSEALGLRYAVSDQLDGNITIQSTGAIPKDALLELFEAALAANGAMIEKHGSLIQIVPGKSGSRSFRLASEGIGDGTHIIVAPLKFVSAPQMVNLLSPLLAEGLAAIPDKRRNLVMLSGSSRQLEAALDALNLFDVDVLAGKSIALAELNSADPEAIVDELELIFENEEGGNLEGVIEFVPNKRLGSVLIITSRSKYLPRAQKWIRELVDVSRFDAAPLIAFIAAKETNYGNETNGRIPC